MDAVLVTLTVGDCFSIIIIVPIVGWLVGNIFRNVEWIPLTFKRPEPDTDPPSKRPEPEVQNGT